MVVETVPSPDVQPAKSDVAVQFIGVSKEYRLYSTPHARLLSQIGLGLFLPKRDRQYQIFKALDNLTFTIKHGERIGIVGRNGAGKTTLLKLITENFEPTSGTRVVNGSVQALMQLGLGFHPEYSGYENIRAALSYNGLTGQQAKEATADIIDFVELGDFLHQPMKTYSLGMNARVQFATATAIRPDILLIDEVMSAGDSYFAAKSALRMDKLAKSGCTVILVSHAWQQIQQYCHRVLWLRDGRVFMEGSPNEVMAAYEVEIAEQTAKHRGFAPKLRLVADNEKHQGEQDPVETEPASVVEAAELAADGENAVPTASETSEAPPVSTQDGAPDWSHRAETFTHAAQSAQDSSCPSAEPPPVSDGKDYAQVSWVVEAILKRDEVQGANEYMDTLRDGHRVFRMPGVPGLHFDYVALTSNGRRVVSAATGERLQIDLEFVADRTDDFACTYWIHFFRIDGLRACRIESPEDRFSLKRGERRAVTLDLGPLILGGGEYLLSFSVFDVSKTGSAADTLNTRFEMLARSYQLKVTVPTDSDPPIVHYPCIWKFGDGKLCPSVVRGA